MYISQFRAVNVGPFSDLSLQLQRGSVGVFGKNGAGKSTLINLMYGLLTNDFKRFGELKADIVRNTAGDRSESYIEGQVCHNGQVLNITRNFKPTKAKPGNVLSVNDVRLTDANKIQEELNNRLGVDAKMLDLYVFKEHDKIYDFISAIPSAKAKAYQVLCRTEICEELWVQLGDYLNKDREVHAEVVDNSDTLSTELTAFTEELAELEKQKEEAAAKLCNDKFRVKYSELIAADLKRSEAENKRTQLEAQVAAAANALRKVSHDSAEATNAFDAALTALNKKEERVETRRKQLTQCKDYATYIKRKKQLEDELAELSADLTTRVKPVQPEDTEKLAIGRKRLAKAEIELANATKTLETLQASGTVECPTCRTPVDLLTDYLETLQTQVASLPGEIKRLADKVKTIETYYADLEAYERAQQEYTACTQAVAKELARLEVVEQPKKDKDELQEWFQAYQALQREVDAKRKRAVELSKTEAVALTEHKQLEQQLKEVTETIATCTVDPEKLEKARRRLSEHENATAAVNTLEGKISGVQRCIDKNKADLKRLKEQLRRTKKIRQMVKIIERAREVLHRACLPRRVAHSNMLRMEGDINEHLGFFGDPFSVEVGEDLSFIVSKPGEPPQSANRLSTGQRVVLSVAFWASVASLWSGELGMLVLDEPTANLDSDNRKMLRDALSAMTAKVRDNRQLIMVTHDSDLRNAFDQVIDLGG